VPVDVALEAIADGVAFLEFSPFSCRKSKDDALLRELVIPFGSTGYMAFSKLPATRELLSARYAINAKMTTTEEAAGLTRKKGQ
jgi:hypothetical protein